MFWLRTGEDGAEAPNDGGTPATSFRLIHWRFGHWELRPTPRRDARRFSKIIETRCRSPSAQAIAWRRQWSARRDLGQERANWSQKHIL
jgi:hypothetical protein